MSLLGKVFRQTMVNKHRNSVKLAMLGVILGMLLSFATKIPNAVQETLSPDKLIKTTGIQQTTTSCKSSQTTKKIFFIEIEGNRCLTRHQLCSVESAALANPSAEIIVYVNSKPFSQITWDQRFATNLKLRNCVDTEHLMLQYKNIRQEVINVEDTVNSSPLKTLWNSGSLANSLWPEVHLKDVLTWALLHQNGGFYVDFNVLCLKTLDCMSNFAVLQGNVVDPSAFGFDKGHGFPAFLIRYLNKVYRPEDITATGSPALTSAINMYCSLNVPEAGSHSCYKDNRIEILPPEAFFPVKEHEMSIFFQTDLFNVTRLSSAYGIRLQQLNWNSYISPASTYVKVTEQLCPWVSPNIPLSTS